MDTGAGVGAVVGLDDSGVSVGSLDGDVLCSRVGGAADDLLLPEPEQADSSAHAASDAASATRLCLM